MLEDSPELLNESAEANGWLVRLELERPVGSEPGGLMLRAEYDAMVASDDATGGA